MTAGSGARAISEKHAGKNLVGVFVTGQTVQKLRAQQPPFNQSLLCEANRSVKVRLFFFSIDDVDLERERISGTCYNEAAGAWEVESYPYPDVIYNRRSEGTASKIRQFRETIAMRKIKSINPVNDFDKWKLYCDLLAAPEIPGKIPHTILYKKERNITGMLKRYRAVYLKPVRGRYSRKVVRVKLLPHGSYEYSYFDRRLRIKIAAKWCRLAAFTRAFFGRRPFIVQQAIPVFQLNGRNVDMRAELQRNYRGDLEIVAISARLAAPHSPVTSVRAGTAVFKFADFFKEHLPSSGPDFDSLSRLANDFVIKVFTAVEQVYGAFGDMGIDFALDRDLKPWLIECNAKSARVALFMSYGQPVIYRSFVNPLEYAGFLAGR